MSTIGEIKMQQAFDKARIMREALEHTTTAPVIQPEKGPQTQKAAQTPKEGQSPSDTR